jgi:hypothetical protein
MKMKLALLLCLLSMMLTACGYWIVEDAPVQVGSSVMHIVSVSE